MATETLFHERHFYSCSSTCARWF